MSYTDIVICIGPLPYLETWPPIYMGYERTVRDRLRASQSSPPRLLSIHTLFDWFYLRVHLTPYFPVGDIPNRYTSDIVLNQQARVAHQEWYGGFAIPGSPVAEVATAVLDAGAYGGSLDKSMADPETGPWRTTDDRPMAGPETGPWRVTLQYTHRT
jgi:hypothetical protein